MGNTTSAVVGTQITFLLQSHTLSRSWPRVSLPQELHYSDSAGMKLTAFPPFLWRVCAGAR